MDLTPQESNAIVDVCKYAQENKITDFDYLKMICKTKNKDWDRAMKGHYAYIIRDCLYHIKKNGE